MVQSDKRSFKGYKFKIWLKKNKDTLKTLIVGAAGLGVFFLPQIPDSGLSAAAGLVTATITKLIVDGFDFWISETEIPPPVAP